MGSGLDALIPIFGVFAVSCAIVVAILAGRTRWPASLAWFGTTYGILTLPLMSILFDFGPGMTLGLLGLLLAIAGALFAGRSLPVAAVSLACAADLMLLAVDRVMLTQSWEWWEAAALLVVPLSLTAAAGLAFVSQPGVRPSRTGAGTVDQGHPEGEVVAAANEWGYYPPKVVPRGRSAASMALDRLASLLEMRFLAPHTNRVRVTFALGVLGSIVLGWSLVAVAAAVRPTVTASPTVAQPGDSITVTAARLPPNQTVFVQLEVCVEVDRWVGVDYPMRSDPGGGASVVIPLTANQSPGEDPIYICWDGSCPIQTSIVVTNPQSSHCSQFSPNPSPSAS